jgi:putative salt-induced outer membrane protein YdiY
LLFFSFAFAEIASSQIVNIEKKRKQNDGLQTTIGLDLNLKETGSKILELKNNLDLQYTKNAHTIILLNNIRLLSVDNGSLVNNGFQHLRYNYTLKDTSFLTFEIFGQYQYNEQKLLQKRILGGLGPRFRLVNKENFLWYAAPLAMFEYEDLNDDALSDSKIWRLDAYININISLNQLLNLNLITYYQPNFSSFSDYRVSGETALRFKINKYLAFDIAYAVDYDNEPPPEVQNTFWQLRNKLVIKF